MNYEQIWQQVLKLNPDEKHELTLGIWDNVAGKNIEPLVDTLKEIWNGVLTLSKDEKIQLAMDTWDSIADEDKPGLTEEQKIELNRRIEISEKGETKFISWEEVKEKLEERISRK